MSFWPFKNTKKDEPVSWKDCIILRVNLYGFKVAIPKGASDTELAAIVLKQLRDKITDDATDIVIEKISRDGSGNILDVNFDVRFGKHMVSI